MQLSRFATNIKIDEDDYMLYSLKTRQYYPYKKEAQEQLEKLLDELKIVSNDLWKNEPKKKVSNEPWKL